MHILRNLICRRFHSSSQLYGDDHSVSTVSAGREKAVHGRQKDKRAPRSVVGRNEVDKEKKPMTRREEVEARRAKRNEGLAFGPGENVENEILRIYIAV